MDRLHREGYFITPTVEQCGMRLSGCHRDMIQPCTKRSYSWQLQEWWGPIGFEAAQVFIRMLAAKLHDGQ